MKRIALAAALTAAFAGSAMAQSSVTLYGRVNTSVEFQDNGDQDKTVMENNASRWGLRGNEDLGGGLSAFFQLEAGFGSDNGSGTGGFSRDAYVGLKSASLGSIQAGKFLGELYYGTIDWIGVFNHNTGTVSEDNFYPLTAGASNSVQYISPVIGGFKFSALASAGEGNSEKAYEGAVQWDSGPFHIGAGYRESEFPGGDKLKGFSIGGSYNWGNFTFGLNYAEGDDDNLGKRDHLQGTVMYALRAHEFHYSAGYTSSDDNGGLGEGSGRSYQWALGYNYNLSKRTKLYAFYFAQDNKNAVYLSPSRNPLTNEEWTSLGVGVRHNF